MRNAGRQPHLIHVVAQELPFRPLGFQSQPVRLRAMPLQLVEPKELSHHHRLDDPDKLYEHQRQLFRD